MHGIHRHICSHKYNIKSLAAYVRNMYDDSPCEHRMYPRNYAHGIPRIMHFPVYCGGLVPMGLTLLFWINSLALIASEANIHLVSVKQT